MFPILSTMSAKSTESHPLAGSYTSGTGTFQAEYDDFLNITSKLANIVFEMTERRKHLRDLNGLVEQTPMMKKIWKLLEKSYDLEREIDREDDLDARLRRRLDLKILSLHQAANKILNKCITR
jgi:hypothetical protein